MKDVSCFGNADDQVWSVVILLVGKYFNHSLKYTSQQYVQLIMCLYVWGKVQQYYRNEKEIPVYLPRLSTYPLEFHLVSCFLFCTREKDWVWQKHSITLPLFVWDVKQGIRLRNLLVFTEFIIYSHYISPLSLAGRGWESAHWSVWGQPSVVPGMEPQQRRCLRLTGCGWLGKETSILSTLRETGRAIIHMECIVE